MEIKVVAGGQNSLVVRISGTLDRDVLKPTTILDLEKVAPGVRGLRLDSMVFAVQEKAGCHLWWKVQGVEQPFYLQVVESRGRFDWEAIRGLHSPQGDDDKPLQLEGVMWNTFGVDKAKGFTIMLDFTKQS